MVYWLLLRQAYWVFMAITLDHKFMESIGKLFLLPTLSLGFMFLNLHTLLDSTMSFIFVFLWSDWLVLLLSSWNSKDHGKMIPLNSNTLLEDKLLKEIKKELKNKREKKNTRIVTIKFMAKIKPTMRKMKKMKRFQNLQPPTYLHS